MDNLEIIIFFKLYVIGKVSKNQNIGKACSASTKLCTIESTIFYLILHASNFG